MTNPMTNPLEPVRVELAATHFRTRHTCSTCGGRTAKVAVLAEVLEGELAGLRVCEGCLQVLAEGASLETMLEFHAAMLLADAQAEAEKLRSAIGRLQVPTYREWGRATYEQEYKALLGACSCLAAIDESSEQTGAVFRADLLNAIFDGLAGGLRGAWTDGAAFQVFAIARAIAEGHLTVEDVAQAAVEAGHPLRDDVRAAEPDADPAPF
jgi:hypothetical protein